MPCDAQCEECGLGVSAGWYHYHEITPDGFGASTLAYCAACGTQYRIDHATSQRRPASRRRPSRTADGQRGFVFLGAVLVHMAAGVPLAFAMTPSPPRLLDSILVGTLVFGSFGMMAVGIAETVAPRSFQVVCEYMKGRNKLMAAGAVMGAAILMCVVGLTLALWQFIDFNLAWPLYIALGSTIFIFAPLVTNLLARILRRGFIHPSPIQELRLVFRSHRPGRQRPNPHTSDHPMDRMWRQTGPVEMAIDQFAKPEIKEWTPFDPGCDVRPIRKQVDRGRLEGAADQLFLSETKCAHCQAVGSITAQGPVRHPCPRCRKGLLKVGMAWMT